MTEKEALSNHDKELENIDSMFSSGSMKAFGKHQDEIMKSFALITETQEQFSQEIDVLKKIQQRKTEDNLDHSTKLDVTSLKRVNDTLDYLFESLEKVTEKAASM